MSTKQRQAIWELCRQGFQLTADDAAKTWGSGERFEPANSVRLGRSLESLIDQCNWEVEQKEEVD